MCAAEAVLSLKKRYKIKLVACIPCANQTEKYSGFARQRYEKILSKCDEKIVLSAYYYPGCMHERNRYMVDNCDSVVCFLRKDSGGTFYTVNYARKYNKTIIEL